MNQYLEVLKNYFSHIRDEYPPKGMTYQLFLVVLEQQQQIENLLRNSIKESKSQ
jgi:hypothetical protein